MLDARAVRSVALMLEPFAELVLLVLEPLAALVETAFEALLAPFLEPLLRESAKSRRGNACRENAEKRASMHRSPPSGLGLACSNAQEVPIAPAMRPTVSASRTCEATGLRALAAVHSISREQTMADAGWGMPAPPTDKREGDET